MYRVRRPNGGEDRRRVPTGDEKKAAAAAAVVESEGEKSESHVEGYADFLTALRALKIPHNDDKDFRDDTVSDPDWKFDWVEDLVE